MVIPFELGAATMTAPVGLGGAPGGLLRAGDEEFSGLSHFESLPICPDVLADLPRYTQALIYVHNVKGKADEPSDRSPPREA